MIPRATAPLTIETCPPPYPWTGLCVRKLRSTLSWTQRQMADELGISPHAVNHWEEQGKAFEVDVRFGAILLERYRRLSDEELRIFQILNARSADLYSKTS